jgi:hypothetical protein
MTSNVLEVVGLACLALAGFLISLVVGFGVVGALSLFTAWRLTR